ncbi:hypothetical protein NEOLEDRAFT_1184313 [Neolentinus lepideus HHB14362 ss-1]|uniref:Uncharacterized protein n=1 Tax=Neolentinus lepideus HHB14362 ss-1 TaxID=1314782 RepID=A0A165MJS1_9AGAM|nr:hypothetical protein NEOLEDRAFT_1184313 [Neolentinus lepideus HHB14362 ss-1]
MGIVGFCFVPLQMLSKCADEIFKAAKAKIWQNMDKHQPGLQAQDKIQRERLDQLAPRCEMIHFPGFLSRPNLPKEGKKDIMVLSLMNHWFSRGTITKAPGTARLIDMTVAMVYTITEQAVDVIKGLA